MTPAQPAALNSLEQLCRKQCLDGLFSDWSYALGNLDVKMTLWTMGTPTHPIFDLASMTKAIMTTPLALKKAWDQGLSETSVLGEIFEAASFKGLENARALRLCDVLRHEAGLPPWKNFYVACEHSGRHAFVSALNEAIAGKQTPAKNVYSDTSMLLLGYLLVTSSGKKLHELFEDWSSRDLRIVKEQSLGPSWTKPKELCAPTGWCPVRERNIQGEVHDENAWALGGFTGHTGLFGTAEQVGIYLQALASSSLGARVISENFSWAQKDPKSDSALGWRTARDTSSKAFGDGDSIGHMGFTGTAFWLNPKTKDFAILLTNRVEKARTSNMQQMRTFRGQAFGLFQNACEGKDP